MDKEEFMNEMEKNVYQENEYMEEEKEEKKFDLIAEIEKVKREENAKLLKEIQKIRETSNEKGANLLRCRYSLIILAAIHNNSLYFHNKFFCFRGYR